MVICLVAHGDFLLPDSPHELVLHMTACRIRWWERFPEDIADVMEEPHSTEENRRVTLLVVQEELRTAVALSGRLRQPILRCFLILTYLFALEIQFTEDALRILIPSFGGLCQIVYRLDGILLDDLFSEILFAQTISCVVATIFSGGCQLSRCAEGGCISY